MDETNAVADATVESRWATWVEKGREQDRRSRRTFGILAPIAIVVAVIVLGILRSQS